MKNRKLRILSYLLAAISLLLAILLYPSLPDKIPTHWDINGTVTYSGKSAIFLTGSLGLIVAVLIDFLPRIDPRRRNYQKFNKYYDLFCVFMQLFLLIINLVTIVETYRLGTLSVPTFTIFAIGFLFLLTGNIMPKFKSNFYMGIKTPWTLSSEEVWHKTHRLGGKCFFIAGLLCLIFPFLPLEHTVIYSFFFLSFILIATFIPAVMSYFWWRQEQK